MESRIVANIIATINSKNIKALDHYLTEVNKLYQSNDVTLLHKWTVDEIMLGTNAPTMIVTLEFPSRMHLDNTFNSDTYNRLAPVREKAFKRLEIYISTNKK